MPVIKGDSLPRPYAYLDPASGRKKTKNKNARSAMIVACFAPPAYILVLHAWAARASTTEITEQIFHVNDLYNPAEIAIETAGQQYLLYSHVVDEAIRRGIRLPVVEGKEYTEDAKDARITATIQPLNIQGRLCIQGHQTALREEITDYPRGATKDLLDALSGCINRIPKPVALHTPYNPERAAEEYLIRAHVSPRQRDMYIQTLQNSRLPV